MPAFIRYAAWLLALALPFSADATVLLRFAHAAPLSSAPGATALDFRINGQPVVAGMTYGTTTAYQGLGGSGNYTIEALRSGQTVPLVAATASLIDGQRYTLVALGNNQTQPFGLLLTQDTTTTPAPNSALLRVIHAAPYSATTPLDITVRRASDGTVLPGFERIPYANPSAYLQIVAQTLEMRVTTPDNSRTFVTGTVSLPAGSVTTVIVTGDGFNQPFELLVLRDSAISGGQVVDQSARGAWTTGNATGQGLTLFPIPEQNRLVGTWYTYTSTGALQWYTLDSCRTPVGQAGCAVPNGFDNDRAVLAVYAPSGGRFLTTDPVTLRIAGTLTVEFQSCTTATGTYNVDGQSGTFTMQNLIPPPTCTIE
ncbi:MAG TPA: DUF4397 domain-containing protein [Xanthomonadales bacterium]|nr:DUF4397 domain-containing protein [Xanthomonadales bacterium]